MYIQKTPFATAHLDSPVMHDVRSPSEDDNDPSPYSAGSPFDGTGNPADLAGGPGKHKPSTMEIGIIAAVSVLAVLSLIGVFIWRARKHRRNAKNKAPESTQQPSLGPEHDAHIKTERPSSTADVEGAKSPTPDSMAQGSVARSWGPFERRQRERDGGEAHEIVTRV